MRLKKINVRIRRDLFIVEKIECDGTVPVNTRFFCGCCGEIVGENLTELKFPFQMGKLIQAFAGTGSLRRSYIGVQHRGCGQTICNVISGGFNFVSPETYFRKIKELQDAADHRKSVRHTEGEETKPDEREGATNTD